jgi:hypothetical protein
VKFSSFADKKEAPQDVLSASVPELTENSFINEVRSFFNAQTLASSHFQPIVMKSRVLE